MLPIAIELWHDDGSADGKTAVYTPANCHKQARQPCSLILGYSHHTSWAVYRGKQGQADGTSSNAVASCCESTKNHLEGAWAPGTLV